MRLVILSKVDGTTVTAAAVGFSDKLNEVPRALRLSMTYDQGKINVERQTLVRATFQDHLVNRMSGRQCPQMNLLHLLAALG